MYKWWLKHREDLTSLCKIISTLIAIATFCGVSIQEVLKIPNSKPPVIEYSVERDNPNN